METSSKYLFPVLFVGHGSPMNAIETNPFSREWRNIASILPKPKAIVCVSAHWETVGTKVTGMETPRTIHDFGGFPQALYQVEYSAPGNPGLASEIQHMVRSTRIELDLSWGSDHGCWSVLNQMYPAADIPVIQLSLDATQPAPYHYELAKALAPIREKEILVLASGNMVHNLSRITFQGSGFSDFNAPYGLDWALEARAVFKHLIDTHQFDKLADYKSLGKAVQLAVPTPEHFLPMLYALALKQDEDDLTYFNDVAVGGSLTMTSFVLKRKS